MHIMSVVSKAGKGFMDNMPLSGPEECVRNTWTCSGDTQVGKEWFNRKKTCRACVTSQQHAGVSQGCPSNMLVYLKDAPATCWCISGQHAGVSQGCPSNMMVYLRAVPATCWCISGMSQQHAGVSQGCPSNMLVYLRDVPATCWCISGMSQQHAGVSQGCLSNMLVYLRDVSATCWCITKHDSFLAVKGNSG